MQSIVDLHFCWWNIHVFLGVKSYYRMKQISHHRQQCKSTIDCTMRTCSNGQLSASFLWTPGTSAANSHLKLSYRDAYGGLLNYRPLRAGDEPIPVSTGSNLRCYTGTAHYCWECTWAPAWELAWEPAWESLALAGVKFTMGSFWPMEIPELVESWANRRL
jgi:hypothetical protein